MVVGLGIDVASVERIRHSLERFGDRLWTRVLTEREQSDLAARTDRAQALAGRFAAKEAAMKALGAPPDVTFRDLEVRRGTNRAPELHLLGTASEYGRRLGVARSLVSITHDAGVAAAVVVLDSEPLPDRR
jgi:holo-[acyl-carrier protein] synthase